MSWFLFISDITNTSNFSNPVTERYVDQAICILHVILILKRYYHAFIWKNWIDRI